MFRCSIFPLRLGRRSPTGTPISTENYTRIPPTPLSYASPPSYVSTHRPANFGTPLQISNTSLFSCASVANYNYGQGYQWSSSPAWKMVHQHPSAAICALTDSQPFLDERSGQSSALEAARIPNPIRSYSDSDLSHDCQGQECCIYEPAVLTTASYNDYPTPVFLSKYPLSLPQSSGLQQHIPTSSHFANNSGEFFVAEHQGVPATPHHPAHAAEKPPPAGTPNAPGVALDPTFHQRRLGSSNAATNGPIIDPVSDLYEDWCSPTEWMCATPNTAQSLDMDRYLSNSHTALTPYDSQNITSEVLYMSHNARSPSPQLHSSPNHPPTSSPSPENLSDLLTLDSSHQRQEAASADLSPAIRVSIEASPVLPTLPKSQSINAAQAVAEKKNRCPLCGICFTQSQVLNRHMKDKHENKGSCAHCSSFKWSRGRPHLYRKHLRAKHSGLTFSEDPPGGIRKARARQRGVPNKKTQVTSREPRPIQ